MGMFSRIGRLFRGFFGLFVSGLEEKNPEALMEAAKQDFRNKMALHNQALARMAGIAERLKSQIKQKTARAQELETRILANHRAGNMDLAGSLARELQELRADLTHDTAELADTEEAYQNNVRQAKVAQKEFEEKIRKLENQLSQVRVKEAQAEAASAMNNVAFKVGDLGDTMKTVEDVLNKRYEQSAGKARVAKDMIDTGALAEKETERKALEQNALAEFLASQGIAAGGAHAETAGGTGGTGGGVAKEMGPAQAEGQKAIGG
ncbi:MAG TPA: PspA/IM30 family protein [Phycisphaerae bacterium]|nr:PspA/IM30 family protein [Phycisphaerae bacterium]